MPTSDSSDCQRCGLCCSRIDYHLEAGLDDIRRWILEGRSDILAHFHTSMKDGIWIPAVDLDLDDVDEMMGADMVDLDEEYSSKCQFLGLEENKVSPAQSMRRNL